MPDLKLLQDELEQASGRYASLREKFKTAQAMPQDVREEVERLHERGLKIKVLIDEEQTRLRDRDFDMLRSYGNEPIYPMPRGSVNADSESKTDLQRAGWELKGGYLHAPTSTGRHVEMFPEEVLFGPVPSDDMFAREYFQKTRAIIQPDYRRAFIKHIQFSARFRDSAIALSRLDAAEQKALSEGTDTAGGYLVPPDLQAEILVRVAARSVMRQLARVVNTSRDKLIWPRVLPHATSGSIYSSGFVGTWASETPSFTETDPGFGTFEIPIRKIRVATKLSNDFLADAITNVPAFLSENGSENMALVEDEGFISGDGSALRPLGILNGGSATVDVEGSTVDTISNTTANAGSAPKLIDLAYALPSQYASRAAWIMRRVIEGDIRKLVDGAGRYLWPPMVGSAFANDFTRELLGSRVTNSEFMPNDGTTGNKVLVYGDISQYIIAQRAQMSTVILRERFADTDQTGLIIFERVGGALWNEDAVRIGVV